LCLIGEQTGVKTPPDICSATAFAIEFFSATQRTRGILTRLGLARDEIKTEYKRRKKKKKGVQGAHGIASPYLLKPNFTNGLNLSDEVWCLTWHFFAQITAQMSEKENRSVS
jgi:hypothetical protein